MEAIETISDWRNGTIFIEKQFHLGFLEKKYDVNISLRITFREIGFFSFHSLSEKIDFKFQNPWKNVL